MLKIKIGLKRKLVWMIMAIEILMIVSAVGISFGVYSIRFTDEYERVSGDIAKSAESLCNKNDIIEVSNKVSAIYSKLEKEGKTVDSTAATDMEIKAYHKHFQSVVSSTAYKNLVNVLQTMLKNNHVKYVYLGFFDVKNKNFVYLADGTIGAEALYPGDIEPKGEDLIHSLQQNNYALAGYPYDEKEYGNLVSTYHPVFDANRTYVCNFCVDTDMEVVYKQRREFLFSMMILMLLLMLPLATLIVRFTDKHLIKPIYQINDAVTDFVSDKQHEDEDSKISALDIHTKDEVEMLAGSIKVMEQEINDYIGQITMIAGEKERIGAELEIATKIQEGMLPHIFPAFPEREEIELYATMTPAKEVGGDFYDFFNIDGRHIGIVMGDVSGKGIPAALFMVIAKTLIKDACMKTLSPKEVLEYVNDQLCENNEAGMFVTVLLGILDLDSGLLKYVNAGHECPAVRYPGKKFELHVEKHDLVVGGLEHIKYTEFEITLVPDEMVFIYTDGVPEATDSHNKMFGTDRMIEALNKNPDASVEDLLANVNEDVEQFVKDAPQFDDLTMLALHFKG